MKNVHFSIKKIVTLFFMSMIFLLAVFALGFFTNLFQLRGADNNLFDLYQAYVRRIFNLSMLGILFILIRNAVVSQLTKNNSILQYILEVFMALGVIAISVYSLTKMGGFRTLYQGVNIDDVRIYYPNYESNDIIFSLGYILNSLILGISVIFLSVISIETLKKRKEEIRESKN